jgi:hypothetical protein
LFRRYVLYIYHVQSCGHLLARLKRYNVLILSTYLTCIQTEWCEWESKVKSAETKLSTSAAKFDASLASLAVLQSQQQHTQALGLENGEVVKGVFHESSSGCRGLVTLPSPRSLSADLNRPRQRQKQASSSWGRRRSTSIEVIDRGAESEGTTMSTHCKEHYPNLGITLGQRNTGVL